MFNGLPLNKFSFTCFLGHFKVFSVYSNSMLRGDQWCHCSLKDSYSRQIKNMIPIEERFIWVTVTKNMKTFIRFLFELQMFESTYSMTTVALLHRFIMSENHTCLIESIQDFEMTLIWNDWYSISLFSFDSEMGSLSIREQVRLHFCFNCWQGIFYIFRFHIICTPSQFWSIRF